MEASGFGGFPQGVSTLGVIKRYIGLHRVWMLMDLLRKVKSSLVAGAGGCWVLGVSVGRCGRQRLAVGSCINAWRSSSQRRGTGDGDVDWP